jgi:molybdopterin converting factor small subunit
MSVGIRLNQAFDEYTGGREKVDVEGCTVRECLNALIGLFPVFRSLLFGSDYALGVLVIHEGDVVVASELDRPVADGGEISLFPMVDGG